MLPKLNRLKKEKDFKAVFQKGKNIKSRFLYFRVLKNNFKKSRFGFIVGRKVSNKAAQRNKVKRRLRSAVFRNLKEIKKPVDIIVVALPQITKSSFSEIEEAIIKTFKNI